MHLERGCILHAQEIAEVYIAAFPESVRFFFKRKKHSRLLTLLTNSFRFILLWGGQALLVRNSQNEVIGYCIYSKKPNPLMNNLWWTTFGTTLRMGASLVVNISPLELMKLAANQLIMITQVKRDWYPPPETGRIVSIAVSPAAQGTGIGTKILAAALDNLDSCSVYLNVRTQNEAGRRMYEGANFQYYGRTRDLLGEWLMMVRPGRDLPS